MSGRLLAFAMALSVSSLVLAAQGGRATTTVPTTGITIVGSVVDASLSPLSGVVVTLERDGVVAFRATSDADGRFQFAGVAPGDYRIRAEHEGFSVTVRDVRIPTDVTTVRLPIVLERPADSAAVTMPSDGAAQTVSPGPPPNARVVGGMADGRGGSSGRAGAPGPSNAPILQAASGERSDVIQTEQMTSLPAFRPPFAASTPDIYGPPAYPQPWSGYGPAWGDSYSPIDPNRFQSTRDHPLSTFGADVDTASYSNVRRFLSAGQLPPPDAVRIEELVNYFQFDYAEPRGRTPIALTTEVGECPWSPSHKLVLIGARAKAPAREVAARNLVLLIDVSGSMGPADRLPLIKTALGLFVDTLRPDDRLAIVTYAGTSGIALPSTPARERDVIQRAIAGLSAGGSTNGGQGLITAYRVAREAFVPGGVNRVILATDGDFNVGIVDPADLVRLIEREKDSDVFLSVFGVGRGNLKDSTMEKLADTGNGHYAYLDSLQEAERRLVGEADATLEAVAKDVKFQVEFNPAVVSAWKLIGYEDRALAARDFNDDTKNGGVMGAGHTVTVLYEVVPVGAVSGDDDRGLDRPEVDPLRYGQEAAIDRPAAPSASHPDEWLTVKARYKVPEGDESALISQVARLGGPAPNLPLASAVAEFGLLLRDQARPMDRWDALARRVSAIHRPAAEAADVQSLGELVALARGLVRLR